jgi:riboflavin kinase/FMN adenylyltransferase
VPMTLPMSAAVGWGRLGDSALHHLGPTVVVLGVFDGLHRGHVLVLTEARRLADTCGVPLVLVTFDPHPATIAGPARDTTTIVSLDERVRLARRHGTDHVLVLRFDEVLAAVTAEGFARTVLISTLHAVHVVVGENFRFGRGGRGDIDLLHRLGERHAFTAHGVRLLPGCSSTRVREMVARGDVSAAAEVLGRPLSIEGRVEGDHVHVDPDQLLPPPGRYDARVDGRATMVTVRADRCIRVHEQLNGRATVCILSAL